ncbi:diamine acetyltransferase 2 [Cimex lectularius]|uniref:N-acetyltransferase domain-containing protein n=1 Tax=Cimex lectularius TaxID=79782 RepID=A0A8I6RGV9_CIMLE|nr:diamine acetyltransferase 2 [Cimex lectularius]
MDAVIRFARREDCFQIRKLIQELANFENMPEGPVIDAKKLEHDGFDKDKKPYKCLIAEEKALPGIIIGYAIFNIGYSVRKGKYVYLEDIMVTEKYRGAGIGAKLLSKVCQEAVIQNCAAVYFVVLDWNPAVEFYAHFQARDITKRDNCHYYVIQKDKMIENANKYCQETYL